MLSRPYAVVSFPPDVSRWESGRNVHSAAMDMLLWLIRDLPGSLDYLRNHAA